MTREEFDNLNSIRKLYDEEDYATASRYAYAYGIRNKDDGMIKYSNVLMKKAKKLKKEEANYQKSVEEFGEGNEYLAFDFARCQLPNGSFYGTSGQCRKGAPVGPKEKAAPKSKAAKDSKKEEANRARSQKQKQNSERAKAFKQELAKRKDEMKGASPEKVNQLIAEASKAADKTEQLRQINTQEGRGGGAGKPVSKASDKAKSSEAQAAGKEARKEMIAARDKEKQLKEARQKADRKVADAKSDLSSAKSDLARKDLTSSERAKATTMKGQAERDLKKQNEAAATARRAHIDSKNEMKAAAQRYKDRQTANNDMRRFGRQEERDKASIKQLQEALKSGKLSPTKQAAVERDIRMRTAREKSATATAKASKDPAVQKRLLQTEIKKVSAQYERLRGKPEAGAERRKLMDRSSEIVKELGKIDAAASKAAGPKKPDTSLLAQQRRSSAAARARD